MAYQRTIWQNNVTDLDATNMNHIEDGIEKAYGVVLLAVVDTAPSECSVGDKYFNTTTNKIYDATDTDTWDTEGYDAESGVFYVVFSEKAIYTYNGTTLVGVGSSGAGGESIPVGSILAFAGSTAPEGYLMCDGSNVSRTANNDLFNVIGTTYGQGDGSTTFGIPNIKGKILVMLDTSQTEFNALGKTGGSKYLQRHNHGGRVKITGTAISSDGQSGGGSNWVVNIDAVTNNASKFYTIDYDGTGDSGNLQPYIVVNYIIKAHPSAVNTSEVVNEHSTSETDVYSCNYVNGIIESGSNANGKYIKYIDGTMICYGTKHYNSVSISNTYQSVMKWYNDNISFPQTFIGRPIVNGNVNVDGDLIYFNTHSITTTTFSYFISSEKSGTFTNVDVDYIAIGKWK